MADYDNSKYTYEQVLAGTGYYMKDDLLRYSAGVKKMQEKLNAAGYDCGTPDGKFGAGTDTAVRNFQRAKGLTVDGKAGKSTLKALEGGSTSGGYDNSRYTYEQVLAGTGYYMKDDLLRYSAGVKKMQEKLNAAGYDCGTPDGKFGAGTDTAVRNFQRAKGLTVDGKAGKNTLIVLEGGSAGGSTGGGNSASSFKEKHGGTIRTYANKYGIDENVLGGFILVESSGSGFSNGKVKIRLENHHFLKDDAAKYKGVYFDYGNPSYTGHKYRKSTSAAWMNCHQNQAQENDAFDFAISLNEVKAYEATSMGLAQIMGFNYSRCGYTSAKAMYNDFSTGEGAQLEGFINFIVSDSTLLQACRDKNYRKMAELYNGAGNVDVYAPKIEKAYTTYKNA